MMKIIGLFLAFVLSVAPAQAQFSATKDAQHIATLKAVVNYKINDAEIEKDIENLRENEFFVNRVQKMLEKLDNGRTQDSTNRKVMKILKDAGEELYKLLD